MSGADPEQVPPFEEPLVALFDVRDPESYLAFEPYLAFCRESGLPFRFVPFLTESAPKAGGRRSAASDRGSRHRAHRFRYRLEDLRRYAALRALPDGALTESGLGRRVSGQPVSAGYLWASRQRPDGGFDYLDRVFRGWWEGVLDIASVADLMAVMAETGVEVEDFPAYLDTEALAELEHLRARAVAGGGFTTPTLLVSAEAFVGRAHLPYLRYRLQQMEMAGS